MKVNFNFDSAITSVDLLNGQQRLKHKRIARRDSFEKEPKDSLTRSRVAYNASQRILERHEKLDLGKKKSRQLARGYKGMATADVQADKLRLDENWKYQFVKNERIRLSPHQIYETEPKQQSISAKVL